MSTEEIAVNQVKPGDKLRATFTYGDADHIVIGTVDRFGDLGGWTLYNVTDAKIERHAPEWQSARVVEAGGRLFGRGDAGSYDPWVEIRTEKRAVRGGLTWFTDQAVAEAAGDTAPKIIVQ